MTSTGSQAPPPAARAGVLRSAAGDLPVLVRILAAVPLTAVQEAAQGSMQITENVGAVADAATSTSAGITQAEQATNELARIAAELRTLTSTFVL